MVIASPVDLEVKRFFGRALTSRLIKPTLFILAFFGRTDDKYGTL
jgi:hypothetical protein